MVEGIGKEYKAEDFKQEAKEVGGKSHKGIFIGLFVVFTLAVAGAWFFMGSDAIGEDRVGAALVNAYCVDSDDGYNRFSIGVTAGISSVDYSEGEWVDKCAGDENKLTEYYCKNDLVVFTTEPCPEGMLCADGICV
jgi:hypothetical protein